MHGTVDMRHDELGPSLIAPGVLRGRWRWPHLAGNVELVVTARNGTPMNVIDGRGYFVSE